MPPKESHVHLYKGYDGHAAYCHIAIYAHGGKTIVVCTEHPQNPGTSITNMAEYLVTDIWQEVGAISLDAFVWIEHYLDRGFVGGRPMFEEDFDLATVALASPRVGDIVFQDYELVLRHPKWKHISQVEVEQLIGEAYVAPELDDRERG